MRIIAVDDEILQLETIVEYLTELYPSAVVSGYTKVSDVLKVMEQETIDVAVLDISMPGNINGITLGRMLRQRDKRVKLLFCTGYSDYALEAFQVHANGYLRKPVRKEELRQEMEYILKMPVFGEREKPYIQTFGNFDVFAGSRPVEFRRRKSKETLAYLTDRKGSWVTNRELTAILWDETSVDLPLSKYVTTVVNNMMADLERGGVAHIVERQRGKLRLRREEVVCDYYTYLSGDNQAWLQFRGEYMSQYSWAEETLAALVHGMK